MKKLKVKYINVICTFDIETTKFQNGAIVYSYAWCLQGNVYKQRTKGEFLEFIHTLRSQYELSDTRRLLVFIHNLPYEFGFIRTWFDWEPNSIFAIGKNPSIVKAFTEGLEFRCSAKLFGGSLRVLGDKLGFPKGDLDYDLVRHSETPLKASEGSYIDQDVVIIYKYIESLLEDGKFTLDTLPLTQTGFVRKEFNRAMAKSTSASKIENNQMTIKDYLLTKEAFRGGFTHANPKTACKVNKNVGAYDLGSAYVAAMCMYTFPAYSFKELPDATIDDVIEYTSKGFGLLIDVTFTQYNHIYDCAPISESKCKELVNPVLDNGRVVSADKMRTVITEVDLEVILKGCEYTTKNLSKLVTVHTMMYSKKERLPVEFIKLILHWYKIKTELKGVSGREKEYDMTKSLINALYGMCASDPIHESYLYDDEGELVEVDSANLGDLEEYDHTKLKKLSTDEIKDALYDWNTKRGRRLVFAWGTWVTAYTRRELLGTVMKLADADITYHYTDTDSIYYEYSETANHVFEERNQTIKNNMTRALKDYGIDPIEAEPKNPQGESFFLGLWEDDTKHKPYEAFKSLGAKRYMTLKEGKYSMTVSGVRKKPKKAEADVKYALDFIIELANIKGVSPFDIFEGGLLIPAEYTGKAILTKCDEPVSGYMTDYLGNTAYVEQETSLVLSFSSYVLRVGEDYQDYLRMRTFQVKNKMLIGIENHAII